MTDILDSLTSEVAVRKDTALTPVGLEKPGIPAGRMPDMPTIFMPQEAIEAAVREVRAQAKLLLQACLAIEVSLGHEVGGPTREEQAIEVKSVERTADAKFADDYAEKQRVAQSAAFAAKPDAPVVPEYSGDWKCPEHGDLTLRVATSRKGRTYRACNTCSEFEA